MRNKYKNILYRALEGTQFETTDFNAEESEDGSYSYLKLQLADTPFSYTCINPHSNFDLFRCRYTLFKANYPSTKDEPLNRWFNIDQLKSSFVTWLKTDVKEYLEDLEEPNLWESEAEKEFDFNNHGFEDRTNFSLNEKAEIRLMLEEARMNVLDRFSPTEEVLKQINERFDYLDESLDRLNRFDWRAVVMSMVLSLGIALSVDTETGRVLWDIFRTAFSSSINLLKAD